MRGVTNRVSISNSLSATHSADRTAEDVITCTLGLQALRVYLAIYPAILVRTLCISISSVLLLRKLKCFVQLQTGNKGAIFEQVQKPADSAFLDEPRFDQRQPCL